MLLLTVQKYTPSILYLLQTEIAQFGKHMKEIFELSLPDHLSISFRFPTRDV